MGTEIGVEMGTGMGMRRGWRWGWGRRKGGDGDKDGDRDRDGHRDRDGAHPDICCARRYFVWRFLVLSSSLDFCQEPYHWPLLICLLLVCLYPFASSCAHTFSSMSARARHICYFCDYGALSLYSLGEPLQRATGTGVGMETGMGAGTGSHWPRDAAFLLQAVRLPMVPTQCQTTGSAAFGTVTLSPRLLLTPLSAPASPATPGMFWVKAPALQLDGNWGWRFPPSQLWGPAECLGEIGRASCRERV